MNFSRSILQSLTLFGLIAMTVSCHAASTTTKTSASNGTMAPIDRKSVSESGLNPAIMPFELRQVTLLDGPFKVAMERNARYLLLLDPDRLLHNTLLYSGLKPKGDLYGGWESRGIAGHTLGHYLTALSLQYASTGDERFKSRVDYIVREMAECQKAYGDGYIGALPPLELKTLRDFKKGIVELDGGFNFKGGAWVPWYTEHKVLTGLKDAWILTGSTQAKDVTLKLADWIDDVTRDLTPDQVQRMLQVEHGGMNETLADIYALTGNAKYLEASHRFYHKAVLDPLLQGRDDLAGKHANTQIPKVIGEARLFEVSGDTDGQKIARYFWDTVVNHYTFAIGGNSEHEHFGEPDQLAAHLGTESAETCNTYNMLKLTRHLFKWSPKAEYFDYYERALYNDILGSQEPEQGMFTYFMSLKPGYFKTFSQPTNSFWCCVGSGMENHTKYNDSIYFHAADELYVNLFIPSRLDWADKGLVVEQKTLYPNSNQITLGFTAKHPVTLSLKLRCPAWAKGGLQIELNGEPLKVVSQPGSYTEIRRAWKTGDALHFSVPMALHSESTPDDASKVALLYGPIVLAGDLGPVPGGAAATYAKDQWDNYRSPKPSAIVPVLVAQPQELLTDFKRVSASELNFMTSATGDAKPVTLRPLNAIFYDYYNVYWDTLTPEQFAQRKAALEAEALRVKDLDARFLDEYRPGEQQSEVDHNQQGENTAAGDWRDRKFRHALNGGWFSFDAKVLSDKPLDLVCTFWGGENGLNRTFDILVDGKPLATQLLKQDKPNSFFEKSYAIPDELTRGKEKVTIRFQAQPGGFAGGLFGARILKR